MEISKTAGRFKLETFTDGYPHWCRLYCDGNRDQLFSVKPEELHDLRHCIDRLLAELPTTA